MRIRAVISVPMLPAQNQPHITDNRRIGRSLGESSSTSEIIVRCHLDR